MNTEYLTKEHIIAIHHELIEQFGGIHGISDMVAELDNYSRCIIEIGDKYIKAWVTMTDWTIAAIPSVIDPENLDETINEFQEWKAKAIRQGQSMHTLSEGLQILSQPGCDLQEVVNNCTKSHKDWDEQRRISIYRCDEILNLAQRRKRELASTDEESLH